MGDIDFLKCGFEYKNITELSFWLPIVYKQLQDFTISNHISNICNLMCIINTTQKDEHISLCQPNMNTPVAEYGDDIWGRQKVALILVSLWYRLWSAEICFLASCHHYLDIKLSRRIYIFHRMTKDKYSSISFEFVGFFVHYLPILHSAIQMRPWLLFCNGQRRIHAGSGSEDISRICGGPGWRRTTVSSLKDGWGRQGRGKQ